MKDLRDFWANKNLVEGSKVHNCDIRVLLESKVDKDTFESHSKFVESKHFGRNDKFLHLGIVPHPFAGDLEKADIFILLLNPGFSPLSCYEQDSSPCYLDAKLRTLRQDFDGVDFPNYHFDPAFAWTGGFQWWVNKFDGVIKARMSEKDLSYRCVLRELAQRVASLELFPYCSTSFGQRGLLNKLGSTAQIRNFAAKTLGPRVKCKTATVIVARGKGHWGFDDNGDNLIVLTPGQARGASLGMEQNSGKAILRQLCKPWPPAV